jgi:hypothetical protein
MVRPRGFLRPSADDAEASEQPTGLKVEPWLGFRSGFRSSTSLEAVSLRSQTLRLLFKRLDLVVELLVFGAVFRVITAQFVEHLVDGELVYYSHHKILHNAHEQGKSGFPGV